MSFTVLARSPRSGRFGAASASRSLAVGNSVIAIDPAVGAVASQAWTNRALRALMLDALALGQPAATVVERVPEWDERSDLRQVAALDMRGNGGAYTGSSNTAWAGHIVEDDFVVIGNLLTGSPVLEAIADVVREQLPVIEESTDPGIHLGRILVAGLQAGEARGGDRRGRQSAAVVVARASERRTFPSAFEVDLRVDDQVDPLGELSRLVDLSASDPYNQPPLTLNARRA